MKRHSLTRNAFRLEKFKNATVIKINNENYLSTELEQYGLKWPEK